MSVHVLYLVSTLSGRIEKGFRIKHRVHLTLTMEPISSAFESAFELFESAFELGESAFELVESAFELGDCGTCEKCSIALCTLHSQNL